MFALAPMATSVAITGTTGIQNNFLNAGDTVTVTVTFSELVNVTGTPQIKLNIGGTLVTANYVSGTGSTALSFSYTILDGQTDINGLGVNANSLGLNGGTITDAAGNGGSQNFAGIIDNISYKVDTTAPAIGTLTLTDTGSSPTDGISQNGTVTVGALESGATWEYSTDAGSTWLVGSGTSFTLAAGTYAAGSVKLRETDLAGNVQTGALIATNAADITVDQTAPLLAGSSPSDNGYLMAVGNNLVLSFNEAVAKGTGLVELFKADGTLVQSFDAATSTALTWSGSSLTINPTADLLANTGYYIKIAATAVKDVAGNAYAGIANATTLNFTTADASGAIVVPVNGIMAIEDLSTIGDFNGDGYDDFIVGAGMNGLSSTGGAAFVVYGNANGTVPNLSAGSIAASAGFKIVSGLTGDYFGIAVNSAGDTNGDGLADLVVTAEYGDASYRESAYVVFGKSNASTVFATGLNVGTGFTASMGYQIKIDETYWGDSVSNAGDVNGDGLSDLLVTSDFSASRNVYVIYGKTGNQSVTLTSYTQFTPDLGYNVLSSNVTDLGQSVYGAGDVNGDGLADFIVSAPNNATDARGMVYVVYGNSTGTSVQLNATNGIAASQGFRILGDTGNNSSYSRFGFSVSSAGDVNGDGLADVMISSPYQPGVAGGAVYVVYGNSSGTVLDMDLRSSSGLLDASRGFRISSSLAGDHLGPYGKDIASAGDINGDGLSDMIISGRDDNGNTTASTYVVYGNASGTNVAIDASGNIAASNGFKLKGAVGFAVASAGDINGDGLNDLLVSARLSGISGSYNVVLGGTQWVTAAMDGAGTFSGTTGSEALIGSAGNDTITGGGGVDRFFAGRGDDTIVLTASDIANLQNNSTGQTAKTTVSGGTGFDTIRLSGGASLDLLKVSNAAAMGIDETSRIEGIERIDMATDTAANVLRISNKDVNDMAGFNQIHTGSASADGKTWTNVSGSALSNITSYHQMVVDGGSNDTVALTANGGAWANVGTVNNGSANYTVYQNNVSHSQVLVQEGVTVDTQAPTLLWSTPADNDYVNTANLGNNITLQFSEAVVKGQGFIQLWNKTTGQPVQAFDVSSSTLVTGWGTSTLTINPTANLAAATDYFIKISDTAIQDSAGLAYSGMNSDLQLNFSTQSADNSYAVPSSFTSASSTSSYLRSVATAGDFNGDGYDDLLVGVAGSTQSGVYVIYGNALGEGLNLDKDPVMSNGVIAADQGFKIQGSGYFGTSVSGIGDVNGDGFADILIGASSDSQGGANAGAAFVVYGSADPAVLNLSSGTIAAARGFKIVAGTGYGSMGDSVSGVGDMNGDGINDFVIGYAGANFTSSGGAAYVVYGKTNAITLTLGTNGSIAAADGFRLTGGVNENAGFSVSGAGDVNGDGLADVIVSANGALSNADGATYVIFGGATGGDMNALVTAGKGFKVTGLTNSTGYHLGTSVSSAGDVNGDGYADLIVGTDADQNYTAAYVVYGGSAPTSVSLAASTIAATQGFRILGNTANGVGLSQVSGAGDLNGDGFADVIVGSTNGSSYVVYGKATGAEVSVSTGTIAASQGFKLTYSTNITSTTAQAVSFAGDFDGDGLNDLVIAEDTDFGNSQTYKIVFGGTQWLTTPVIGNGAVTGTAASEAILGSTANDTLTGGGGVDRFFAGMGNDTIVLTGTDVTNLGNVAAGQTAKASVSGGGGFDTIRLSGGAALNLTTISNAGAMGLEENSRIESIERIDLATDTAANTLTLTAKDVNDTTGFNLIRTGTASADGNTWTNVSGTALSATTKFHQMVVTGAANDVVNLSTETGWANAGTVNNGTSNYTVWQNTAKSSQVLVQSGATVITPVGLALASDTGASATDFITKNGTMNVNLSVTTDAWSYSTDSGTTWTTGSGTSFVLGAGSYAANAVQVRETTSVGQTVGKFANALTVDTAAPTVAVTMSNVALSMGQTSTVTFQFSENVANFDINDVSIQNSAGGAGAGGLSALTKVSDSKWTAVYTPTAEANTTANHIVVALNGYIDVAGNNGSTGQSTFNVDTRFSSSLTAGFYGTTSSSSSANSSVTTNAVIVDYWNPAWQGDTIKTYKNGSQIDSFTISGATNSKSLGNLTASPGDTFYSTITHNGVTYNLFNMIKVNPGTAGLTRYDSPLVLDLNGDGVQTVDIAHGTMFDLQATGTAQATGWVDAHDGLLAIDLNHDGKINNGAELFGNSTLLADGQKAATGWTALAQHDSNVDGKVDAQDAVFDALMVWQDANGNGVTDAGELRSLKETGVISINLGHDNTITHQNGNLLQGVSSFTTTDGQTHEVVDAWFQTVTEGVQTLQNGESVDLSMLINASDASVNNLPSFVSQLGAIDKVDLSGMGAKTLKISLHDVLTGTTSGSLQVTGNADDTVQLDASEWTNSGRVVDDNGHSYAVFNASHGVAAQLLMDQQMVQYAL
ncbi:MAG: FG-GAP repeat protein [Limnohabitans sp.]|nr:FG-GAP repeat protein [Limnohabitans sp.]